MKLSIEWLDPKRTKARVTIGRWRKQAAELYYKHESYERGWYFAITGDAANRELRDLLNERRVWEEVKELPEARVV